MLAVTIASAISSIAGFAFSAICGAIVFHLSANQVQLVETMIVCSVANQSAMVWAMRRDIEWRRLRPFLLGGFASLPVGAWILLNVARQTYVRWLGAFLIVYGTYMLLRRPVVIQRQSEACDALAGVLGGITGGAIGFPGAFVTIWCGFKGWSKEQQRAVFQPFILFMQVGALVLIAALNAGPHGRISVDWGDLLCVPGSLLGTAVGMHLYRRLSDTHFAIVVNALLIVSGLSFAI
ncbi:sulfite exporter TauE/SafE family protein [Methylobacterium sp. JK268]